MCAGDVVWAGGYCSWVVRMGSHVMPGTILHIIQIYKDTALASNTQLWENQFYTFILVEDKLGNIYKEILIRVQKVELNQLVLFLVYFPSQIY